MEQNDEVRTEQRWNKWTVYDIPQNGLNTTCLSKFLDAFQDIVQNLTLINY
jgi:hypothetical protein